MKLPSIIVNFKLYEQATGDSALKLAKIHDEVAKETGASIGIAVNPLDLSKIVDAMEVIPVFSQHIDPVGYGSHTGHILPELVKEHGAYGTIINHSEFKMEDQRVAEAVQRAREVDLYTIVCADSPEEAKKILACQPDLIAVEPPELIGGDISVSKASPYIIEEAVEIAGDSRVLVGAGVKDADDVKIALALGAKGVLLASGVTKADDPYSVLMDLVSGMKA